MKELVIDRLLRLAFFVGLGLSAYGMARAAGYINLPVYEEAACGLIRDLFLNLGNLNVELIPSRMAGMLILAVGFSLSLSARSLLNNQSETRV